MLKRFFTHKRSLKRSIFITTNCPLYQLSQHLGVYRNCPKLSILDFTTEQWICECVEGNTCSQCWKPMNSVICHVPFIFYYRLFFKFCHWTSYFEIHLRFQKIFICICVWEGVMHKNALPMEAWRWLRSPWARVPKGCGPPYESFRNWAVVLYKSSKHCKPLSPGPSSSIYFLLLIFHTEETWKH